MLELSSISNPFANRCKLQVANRYCAINRTSSLLKARSCERFIKIYNHVINYYIKLEQKLFSLIQWKRLNNNCTDMAI